MDTSHGPVPGMEPSLLEFAAEVALRDGKDALKELLDAAKVLETPAYERLLRERPGYQAFVDRKWASLSHVMWAALVREIAHQPDDLQALAGLTCPTLVIVGDQDEPFLGPSHAIAAAMPDARLVVIPDAGHSPQFENPTAWYAALDGFLASLPEPAGRP
jgi:pimeloyl-ACP methyl ester carboxylesterase